MTDEKTSCDGCGWPIVEGEHHMLIATALTTKITAGSGLPALEPTKLPDIAVHNPQCYLEWCRHNRLIQDVLGTAS